MSKTDTAASTIVPRDVKFDWQQSPLHWIRDDAVSSHALNEFSYLLT